MGLCLVGGHALHTLNVAWPLDLVKTKSSCSWTTGDACAKVSRRARRMRRPPGPTAPPGCSRTARWRIGRRVQCEAPVAGTRGPRSTPWDSEREASDSGSATRRMTSPRGVVRLRWISSFPSRILRWSPSVRNTTRKGTCSDSPSRLAAYAPVGCRRTESRRPIASITACIEG